MIIFQYIFTKILVVIVLLYFSLFPICICQNWDWWFTWVERIDTNEWAHTLSAYAFFLKSYFSSVGGMKFLEWIGWWVISCEFRIWTLSAERMNVLNIYDVIIYTVEVLNLVYAYFVKIFIANFRLLYTFSLLSHKI